MIYVEHHLDPVSIKSPTSKVLSYDGEGGNLFVPSAEVFGNNLMYYFKFDPYGLIHSRSLRENDDVVKAYRYNVKDPD